jgi:hypothetical protein
MGAVLETVRFVNDVERLASVMARAGECPEVCGGSWSPEADRHRQGPAATCRALGVRPALIVLKGAQHPTDSVTAINEF